MAANPAASFEAAPISQSVILMSNPLAYPSHPAHAFSLTHDINGRSENSSPESASTPDAVPLAHFIPP